jgi:hypothetical protein
MKQRSTSQRTLGLSLHWPVLAGQGATVRYLICRFVVLLLLYRVIAIGARRWCMVCCGTAGSSMHFWPPFGTRTGGRASPTQCHWVPAVSALGQSQLHIDDSCVQRQLLNIAPVPWLRCAGMQEAVVRQQALPGINLPDKPPDGSALLGYQHRTAQHSTAQHGSAHCSAAHSSCAH